MDIFLFLLFALIAVGCAVNLLAQRHPIASALSLIGVLGSLAVLYLLLGAEFIAAIQVIVYAGAIMVLFVFVIMLLNAGEEQRTKKSKLARMFGLPLFALLLIEIAFVVLRQFAAAPGVVFGGFIGSTEALGRALFRDYLLPFEATSVLFLVAIIGAVVLGRKEI
ncbi:MAG TPA: NADH-quinone oxidoreductase subunit J [Bryobacterales bacterium]|nr:NADH-quinone oxidoreductase subunit J [Bryobacterales bacterium]